MATIIMEEATGDVSNQLAHCLEGGRVQEELLKACEAGDANLVSELLKSEVQFNINCTDFLGRTPLQIGLEKEDMQLIELLLPHSSISNIEATLLHAINESKETIACTIIRHGIYTERIHPLMKRLGTQRGLLNTDFCTTSGFYLDTTPLILAAQRELYTVVKLLLLQGSEIDRPHTYDCSCGMCEDKYSQDYMRYAHRRLNAYKGLTSTSYITLGSPDPFAEAFRLKKEVCHLAAVEKYFKSEYTLLAKKLSSFLVKLVDNIRGTRELDLVLNKVDNDCDTNKQFSPMARFRYAIVHKEKEFISHASCQMKLNFLWFSHARFLDRANWGRLFWIFILFILLYPPAAVIHIFFPNVKALSKLDTPAVKFMAHAYSFFAFIMFLIVRSFTFVPGHPSKVLSNITHYENQDQVHKLFKIVNSTTPGVVGCKDVCVMTRNVDVYTFDVLISIWVIGMLWSKCRKLWAVGAKEHVARYNIYEAIDTAMIFLYITSITLCNVVIHKTRAAEKYFHNATNVDRFFTNPTREDQMHWHFINADRYMWSQFDPTLIGEIAFATANILSFARISYVLAASEYLGPLQISLGRMTTDILRFVVLFMVLFTAFMVGIDNLMWPFFVKHRETIELASDEEHDMEAGKNFGTIMVTFRSIFWLSFGLAEYSLIDFEKYDLEVTQNAAYILLGGHIFCIVIVMLNMLIAMMSRSYEQIEQEADVEFKFARSALYLEYCDPKAAMPVPLNLLPRIYELRYLIQFMREMFGANVDDDANEEEMTDMGESMARGRRHKELHREMERVTYNQIIKNIVQRFISDVTKCDDDEVDNNIDAVRQDIHRLKLEVTGHIDDNHSQQTNLADCLVEVRSALTGVQKQQEDILQQFNECVTKLNTFENMVANNVRRNRMFAGRENLAAGDDAGVEQRRERGEQRREGEEMDNVECTIS